MASMENSNTAGLPLFFRTSVIGFKLYCTTRMTHVGGEKCAPRTYTQLL